MDDLTNFLDFLYEKQEGYVYVATKDTLDTAQAWNQNFYDWPSERQNVIDFIIAESASKDVFVAPALFKNRSAMKRDVKGTNVVWVEYDGQQEIDFQDLPKPDCIIQSSTESHLHCYWKIPYLSDVGQIEAINRKLMYYTEADFSGFDASQVLRPPVTHNWKHDGLPVILKKLEHQTHSLTDFDVAPEVQQEVKLLNDTMLLEPIKLLQELSLHANLRKKITTESVSPESRARSSFLMRIAHELTEEGCNHIQIVSLLAFADERIGKFSNRRDRLTRLSEIAARALLYHQIEEGVTLYSPLDVLNYKEDLEWLIEMCIHRSGFGIITGLPGCGKTTLTLQLMKHLVNGEEFLSLTIQEVQKILFISLELSILELKYFYGMHQKAFENNQKWIDNIRIIDQNVSLNEFEEIIAEYEPTVIFIDSLTELATEELKESEGRAITRWIRKIRRRYNCAVICIHHNRKDKKGKYKETVLSDVYGTFIFGKDADFIGNLERDEDEIAFYSLKRRYGSRLMLDLEQNSENLIFTVKEVKIDSGQPVSIGDGKINIAFS